VKTDQPRPDQPMRPRCPHPIEWVIWIGAVVVLVACMLAVGIRLR
jgi:hypothetical protein